MCDELAGLRPSGINFGPSPEYEDRARSYRLLLEALPKIDGLKPTTEPPDFGDIAQNRLHAMELDEPSAHRAVEDWINEPDRELREKADIELLSEVASRQHLIARRKGLQKFSEFLAVTCVYWGACFGCTDQAAGLSSLSALAAAAVACTFSGV